MANVVWVRIPVILLAHRVSGGGAFLLVGGSPCGSREISYILRESQLDLISSH